MSERASLPALECPRKKALQQIYSMASPGSFGLEGVPVMAMPMTPPPAEMYDLSCEAICDGPMPLERAGLSLARILGLGDTYDVCPIATQVELRTQPPAAQ